MREQEWQCEWQWEWQWEWQRIISIWRYHRRRDVWSNHLMKCAGVCMCVCMCVNTCNYPWRTEWPDVLWTNGLPPPPPTQPPSSSSSAAPPPPPPPSPSPSPPLWSPPALPAPKLHNPHQHTSITSALHGVGEGDWLGLENKVGVGPQFTTNESRAAWKWLVVSAPRRCREKWREWERVREREMEEVRDEAVNDKSICNSSHSCMHSFMKLSNQPHLWHFSWLLA